MLDNLEKEEIEVTPAMIEAADDIYPRPEDDFEARRDTIIRIFMAMIAVSKDSRLSSINRFSLSPK